jgi:hypothetical protein
VRPDGFEVAGDGVHVNGLHSANVQGNPAEYAFHERCGRDTSDRSRVSPFAALASCRIQLSENA